MFHNFFEWLMRSDVEGGYSNDKNDKGGETKYGISSRAYPLLDIENLTKDQAAIIYKRDYWDDCSCDQMPYKIAMCVADCAVNQGQPTAKKLLQEALNKSLINSALKIDGIIGAKTLAAIRNSYQLDFVTNFMALRAQKYAQDYLTIYDFGQFRRLFNLLGFINNGR